MKVTKLFEITFDEPGPDWLCPDNLNLVLTAALEPLTFEIRELTNREQYLERFKVTEIVPDKEIVEIEPEETSPSSKPLINVAERNAALRAAKGSQESISSKIKSIIPGATSVNDIQDLSSGEDIKDTTKLVSHIAPGPLGKACTNPRRHREKVPGGGTIEFCPTCGFQYLDTDLLS